MTLQVPFSMKNILGTTPSDKQTAVGRDATPIPLNISNAPVPPYAGRPQPAGEGKRTIPTDGTLDSYVPFLEEVKKVNLGRAVLLYDRRDRVRVTFERYSEAQKREDVYRHNLNDHTRYVNGWADTAQAQLQAALDHRKAALQGESDKWNICLLQAQEPYKQEVEQSYDRLYRAQQQSMAALQEDKRAAAWSHQQAQDEAVARHTPRIDKQFDDRRTLLNDVANVEQASAEGKIDSVNQRRMQQDAQVVAQSEVIHQAQANEADRIRQKRQRAADAEAVIAQTCGSAGLLPHEDPAKHIEGLKAQPRRRPMFRALGTLLATMACGTIFGFSMGTLTGLIHINDLSLGPTSAVIALGAMVFCAMGYVAEWGGGEASKSLHSHPQRARYLSSPLYPVIAIAVAGLLTAGLCAIEMSVEKWGVLRTLLLQDPSARISGKPLPQPGEPAFWLLAAVVAVPILLVHLQHGWTSAEAASERKRALEHARQSPEMQELTKALAHSAVCESHLETYAPVGAPEVQAATLKHQALKERIDNDPIAHHLLKQAAEKSVYVQDNLMVKRAEEALTEERNAMERHPQLVVARQRLEEANAATLDTLFSDAECSHLDCLQARMENDACVVLCNSKLAEIQVRLDALEVERTEELSRIDGLRERTLYAPTHEMQERIRDSYADWEAAQQDFDTAIEETILLMQLPGPDKHKRFWKRRN
jgi:hypothetical protein